jgi:hypothetical protein
MAAKKTLERLIDREERKDGARVREHHHEARQRTHAPADPDRAEAAPVDLCFFGGERGEAAIDRRGRRRTDQTDRASQLHDRARVTPALHHLEEPRRAQAWVLSEQ